MNEEELKKKEEDLNKKQEELNKKQEELEAKTKEIEIKSKELEESKVDTETLVKQIKEDFEAKNSKLVEKYETRLEERNKVIKQLMQGDKKEKPVPSIADKINERRAVQNKKW